MMIIPTSKQAGFHNQKRMQGLSLIELLVGITISSILLLGVSSIYLNSRQTDQLGSELSRLQETGRHALGFLAKDIRMAGYQGCLDPTRLKVEVIADNPPTADIFATALRGFEVRNGTWANGTEFDNQPIESMALVGSDVIALQGASATEVTLTGNMTASNANIQILGNPLGFAQNQVIVIADCEYADMFRITNDPNTPVVPAAVTLTHAMSNNSDNRLQKAYDDTATVMAFQSVVYFVGNTGRMSEQNKAINALYRQTHITANNTFIVEELIEGIDSMQIIYGELLASGNHRYLPADDIAALQANAIADLQLVDSIQLGLLVSGSKDVIPSNDDLSYELPGETIIADSSSAGTTDVTHEVDKRLRRDFSMTINIRNR
jgi:type IV pilus assembly protein PilW